LLTGNEESIVEILRTTSLMKRFGGLIAVNNVDLSIAKEEMTSIIGPNGAGKTTLFNLLTGLLKPDGGQIRFEGNDITGHLPHKIVKAGIARSFQILNIFNELSLFENIRVAVQAARGHGLEMLSSIRSLGEVNERSLEIIRNISLDGKEDVISRNLSYGDKRILEIGIALASNPKLLLLDEPTSGLAGRETGRMTDFIKKLAGDLTIVVIEHDMNIVLSISDHIAVLHQGKVIAEGSPGQIRQNDEVQEAYLGGLE
jgi:branched-chain amino acid transport system ATP-binding protein